MRFVVGDRASGKTTALVTAHKVTPESVLIVADQATKDMLVKRENLNEREVFTVNQVKSRGLPGLHPKVVYVDNVDILLRALLGVDIVTATTTGDVVTVNYKPPIPEF